MLNHLKNELNVTHTENGAVALNTTKNEVLDFFAVGGALRNRSESEIIRLFTKAFAEDRLLALKVLFYLRDIREGQGERRTFRTILKYLGDNEPEVLAKNIHLVSEYGRWDDLYVLLGTRSENSFAKLVKEQFESDLVSEHPSLLAKWLSSANSKQKATRKEGLWTAKVLGLTEKEYRKALSSLRAKLDVVERKMVAKEWGEIKYPGVPSKAMLTYRNAFSRNDEERYASYLESLNKGETKVNASTLYPYELVRKVVNVRPEQKERDLYDGMWNSLPDYTNGKEENAIAVVDVSASMTWEQNGLALHSAIGLGMYLAEHAKGPYANHFMTFSDSPTLIEIKGKDFTEKVHNVYRSPMGYSTNLESIFNLVLKTAVNNDLTQDEMLDKLYIVTDMEFNQIGGSRNSETVFRTLKRRFADEGYELPKLVFINVNARNTHFPMEVDENGVVMVSGMSPTIFESLMGNEIIDGFAMMMNVIGKSRYDAITV